MSRFASFRPSRSLSPTFRYVRLILSLALSPPSLVVDRSPRSKKRDRGRARQVSSLSPSSVVISPPYFTPFFGVTDHLDGRLSTHQGPTSPLPTDRLCPRRENSRGVDLVLLPDTCLTGAPFRRRRIDSFLPIFFFFFLRPCCFRTLCDFLQAAVFAKSITQRPASACVIMP